MDKEYYEEDLKRRKQDHLDSINNNRTTYGNSWTPAWKPCLHDGCLQCVGTGIKSNGEPCVHMLSCSCPKCTPYC